ncbi:hypothetical protein SLE2022_359130 [Rubroshorea leprosula]
MSTPRDSSDDISPEQQPEEGEIISPQRETAGNEEVTEGDGGGEGRKREREGDSVASSSGTRPRRRGELDAPRSVDPACYVCGKQFASWKAVFGHLRSHPRAHSGAFPPPKFSPDSSPIPNKELQEQLAPTLLNLAREALEKMEQDQEPTPDAAAVVSRRRGLGVDLNDPIRTDSSDVESFPGTNGGHNTGLDLNKAPNENDSDGNDAAAN